MQMITKIIGSLVKNPERNNYNNLMCVCVCVLDLPFILWRDSIAMATLTKKIFNRVGSITVSEVEYIIILVGSWCQAGEHGTEVAQYTTSWR